MISYVNYDKSLWKKNVVNSPLMSLYEHVTIIPADGKKELELENTLPHLEEGDTWRAIGERPSLRPRLNLRQCGGHRAV